MWVHAKGRSVGIRVSTMSTIFSSTLNSSACPAGAEREADSKGNSILQSRPGGLFATSSWETVSQLVFEHQSSGKISLGHTALVCQMSTLLFPSASYSYAKRDGDSSPGVFLDFSGGNLIYRVFIFSQGHTHVERNFNTYVVNAVDICGLSSTNNLFGLNPTSKVCGCMPKGGV